nr:MAG TPA: hypothetical protein [Caudoviricetes sp.]
MESPVLHRRKAFLLCYRYYMINRINVQEGFQGCGKIKV